MEDRNEHQLSIHIDFGRGLNHCIAVCGACGAEWYMYYSPGGVEIIPIDNSKCPARENYRQAVAKAEQEW